MAKPVRTLVAIGVVLLLVGIVVSVAAGREARWGSSSVWWASGSAPSR